MSKFSDYIHRILADLGSIFAPGTVAKIEKDLNAGRIDQAEKEITRLSKANQVDQNAVDDLLNKLSELRSKEQYITNVVNRDLIKKDFKQRSQDMAKKIVDHQFKQIERSNQIDKLQNAINNPEKGVLEEEISNAKRW